jgi:hypothetical protein
MKNGFVLVSMCALAASAQADIVNPSFEIPALGTGLYSYNTAGATWVFANHSGEAATGSPWFTGSPPEGNQAAFLQNIEGDTLGSDSISQGLTGLTPGTSYNFTFFAAQRPEKTVAPITVFLGTNNLGTFTPISTAFSSFTTSAASATSANMTLSFVAAGASTGDWDSAIDKVGMQTVGATVPEPNNLVLLCACVLAIGSISYRKQRN